MSDLRLFITPDDVRRALAELGPIGDLGEAYVKTAVDAWLHLTEGGTVNGARLVATPADAVRSFGVRALLVEALTEECPACGGHGCVPEEAPRGSGLDCIAVPCRCNGPLPGRAWREWVQALVATASKDAIDSALIEAILKALLAAAEDA